MDRETALDRLAAVPLDDFVAERKRLAKELRGAGDRDAAAEVAKLPKPTAPAWALNHLAREDPAAIAGWLDAAEALRHASTHAAEVGGDELRAAMAAHRDATRDLMAAVRDRVPLSAAMQERVRALLQAATADPDAAERLRSGRIVEGAAEAEVLPGAVATPTPPAAPRRRPARESDEQREARERAEAEAHAAAEEQAAAARADLERRAGAASAELERLRELAAEREEAAAAAEERLEEARRTLNRSGSEMSAARSALDDARGAVTDAEREVRTLIAQLRGAS